VRRRAAALPAAWCALAVLAGCSGGDSDAPIARFEWSVPERADSSWDAWGAIGTLELDLPVPHTETLHGYDPAFVTPDTWTLALDACASEGTAAEIAAYRWTVTRGDDVVADTDAVTCRHDVDVPALGDYSVRLTVEDADGRRGSVTHPVEVRDILVVSLGDSSASGEGNVGPEGWEDRRCHRSRTSGHALAAAALEADDPTTSVTFLSLACSGAMVSSGVLAPYMGIDPLTPPADRPDAYESLPLEAQVDAMVRAVCGGRPHWECDGADQRRVDVLLVNAGINELGFGAVVARCAFPTSCLDSDAADGVEDGLRDLVDPDGPASCPSVLELLDDGVGEAAARTTSAQECAAVGHSFGHLAARLDDLDVDIGRVFLGTYPAGLFTDEEGEPDSGCGLLFGLSKAEARRMTEWGDALNRIIGDEATRLGWVAVTGTTEAFRGHGYCTADSWFVQVADSVSAQGDIEGTVHPDATGHAAIAELFTAAIAAAGGP